MLDSTFTFWFFATLSFLLDNSHFFFNFYLFIFGCAGAFSSCSEQGLVFDSVHGLLIAVASLVVEHEL